MNTKSIFVRRVSAMMLVSALSAGVQAGVTERVSVDSEGREGIAGSGGLSRSVGSSISADGRYVAFASLASNLVEGDTNGTGDFSFVDGTWDVFVHDRQTGATTRVSVDSAGRQGNGSSSQYSSPSLSADGRYVAFVSEASNLVPGDTNHFRDVFVHDRQTGATTRVSVNSAGGQGDASSYQLGSASPSISADGRYVAFVSEASNLVAGDTNDTEDVFVHDRQTGATTRVSVNNAGWEGNGASSGSSISADGRYVAFGSVASNLVRGDTNAAGDIFVHDRQTGATTRVSVDSAGAQAFGGSAEDSSISADGRYVAFLSDASNLVAGDTNEGTDIFVHDRQTGVTTGISMDGQGHSSSTRYPRPSMSANGRYVAFDSYASNLVAGDTNYGMDIFVHDRLTTLLEGPTELATCADGLDNDNDGYLDANDSDCAPVPAPRRCNGKRVTIVGTPGSDHYTATPGDDVISGLAGDDMINGAGGNDVICGGDGDDTLIGSAGKDRLFGGPGDDMLRGGSGGDQLNAGPGVDSCDGQAGTDHHLGGCETLTNVP